MDKLAPIDADAGSADDPRAGERVASSVSPRDEWFRVLVESTSAALFVYGRGGRVLYANRAAEELTGYSLDELLALDDIFRLVGREFEEAARERPRARMRGEEVPDHFKFKFRHRSGEERWAEVSSHSVIWGGEPATAATVVGFALSSSPEALSRQRELAQVTLAAISEGVIRTTADGRVDYMNLAAERLTGWPLGEAVGRGLGEVYQVFEEGSKRPRPSPVEACLAERRSVEPPGVFVLRDRGGEEHVIRDSAAPVLEGGEIIGTVVVFRDLTRMRGLEREMVYLASHDALTGLVNRQELEIHLEAALESARDQGAHHALLYIDLREFKLVNDCYGLVAGDELLRQVAELLESQIGDRAIIGRMGGDDFAALVESCSLDEAQELARDLRRAFRAFRFNWAGQHFEVGLSIGLVGIDPSSESVIHLLKAADAACYLAQRYGRNRIHVYAADDAAVAERYGRLHWVQRLRTSLHEDRFCLYHQKIQPLAAGEETWLHEVLVRMVDEDGTHVPPGEFIPIAEDHDLAPALDRWVLRRVLQTIERGELAKASVSVNLSGHSLSDETFLDDIAGYVGSSGVASERLFFEITETAAVANLSRALRFMEALRELGCRFILDDFGSGVSSFAYLKNLPVDVLKIDGEFVRSMEIDPIRRAMVESIHQIGHVMGLRTIAEWVENEATYEMLRELGVDFVQGYWVHRPEALR